MWQGLASDLRALQARMPSFLVCVCGGAAREGRVPDPRVPHKVRVTRDWDVWDCRKIQETNPIQSGRGTTFLERMLGRPFTKPQERQASPWTPRRTRRGASGCRDSRLLSWLLPVHNATVSSALPAAFSHGAHVAADGPSLTPLQNAPRVPV